MLLLDPLFVRLDLALDFLNQSIEQQTNGTQGLLTTNQIQAEINHIPNRIHTEVASGKIPSNETVLVIYANSEVGPVDWQGSINELLTTLPYGVVTMVANCDGGS